MTEQQAKNKFTGKTVICLATGNEVYIYPSFQFESYMPYTDEVWAFNDENALCLVYIDGQEAEILHER